MKLTNWTIGILAASLLPACGGGGSLREVQGAKFALNANESETADRIEEGVPSSETPGGRCRYWKAKRWNSVSRDTSLSAWVKAKTREACNAGVAQQAAPKPCPLGVAPPPRPGETPCTPLLAPSPSASTSPVEAEPPPAVPSDPVELFKAISKMRPFNSQFIDLHAVAVFVTAYAALAQNPETSNAARQVVNSIHLSKQMLMVPSDILQLDNLTSAKVKLWTRQPIPICNTLFTVVHYSGALYQQFVTEQRDRLSPDDLQAMNGQVTSGGPQSTNEGTLLRVRETLMNEVKQGASPSGGAAATSVPVPSVTLPTPAPPIDPAVRQQVNDRLDAAVVDDCLTKLDTILSTYEQAKNPSVDHTLNVVPTFSSTFERQCGMQSRVKTDPRFAALTRRLSPIADKADDAAWARAKDACTKAIVFPGCSAALDFAKNNNSHHKNDAEQLARSPHVQRLSQQWAAAEASSRQKRQEQCDRCMATCRGNGTSDRDCRGSDHCGDFCQ